MSSSDPRPLSCAAADLRRTTAKTPASFWSPILWGVTIGVVGTFFPFFRFFARALSVAVHEVLGHAATFWFFASPSIPAPNLLGETGHAVQFGYSTVVYTLWLAVWVWL